MSSPCSPCYPRWLWPDPKDLIFGTNLIATCLLVSLQEVNAWDSDKLSVNTLFITWHGAELAFSELLEILALPRLIWGGGDHFTLYFMIGHVNLFRLQGDQEGLGLGLVHLIKGVPTAGGPLL